MIQLMCLGWVIGIASMGKTFPIVAVLNAALYCSFLPVFAFKADCFKTRSFFVVEIFYSFVSD